MVSIWHKSQSRRAASSNKHSGKTGHYDLSILQYKKTIGLFLRSSILLAFFALAFVRCVRRGGSSVQRWGKINGLPNHGDHKWPCYSPPHHPPRRRTHIYRLSPWDIVRPSDAHRAAKKLSCIPHLQDAMKQKDAHLRILHCAPWAEADPAHWSRMCNPDMIACVAVIRDASFILFFL